MTCPLTPRQLECVKLLADGKTYDEIAIIIETTRFNVMAALQRARNSAEAYNSAALVAKALRKGWIQ